MPDMVRSAPVREENEAHHYNQHKEMVLSDHDALLLLIPLPNNSVARCIGQRCDGGNLCV